jgi:single-stranded-DNA-specific exonuclease
VTDHHESGNDKVARAHAVVNPKLGTREELKILAGVGVAFKLAHALIRVGREREYPQSRTANMRKWMYLVALGTVADMVPLEGENRFLVRYGMSVLNSPKREPGIQALIQAVRIDQEITSYHIGFVLGPRINAAGRMGSPDRAVQLLLTDSPREAQQIARSLDEANQERQAIEEAIRNEAMDMLEAHHDPDSPGVIVVGRRGWHSGVVGIVASRLVRRFHRPAIVISIDEADGVGHGSCRSIEGFDLIRELGSVSNLLEKFGGHRMAAGLDVREENLDDFREAINVRAREVMANTELRPTQMIDGWLNVGDVTHDFLRSQERLMPFGHQNPVPVWALRRIRPHRVQTVGRDGKHLRLLFHTPHGVQDAIAFGFGDRELPEGEIDIAFQLRRNVFRGEERLQLMVQDLRRSVR